jgi:signal transduction histidine kinase
VNTKAAIVEDGSRIAAHVTQDSAKALGVQQGTPSNPRLAVLWMLGVLGFLLGAVLYPLLTFEGMPPLGVVVAAALPVMFWMYLAAGLIAWWRRPRNGMGMLLVWSSVGMWIIVANNTSVPALVLAAPLFTQVKGAMLVHLLLAFPAGRLPSARERVLVTAAYVVAVGLQAIRVFVEPPAWSSGWSSSGLFGVLQLASVTALNAVVAAVLIARLAKAMPEQRRSLGVVYGYGMFVVAFLPLVTWVFNAHGIEQEAIRDSIQLIAYAAVPVVVLVTFLLGGFRRTAELEALSSWLGEAEASRTPIEGALATALGDPTLKVDYWSAELRDWVRAEGQPVARPGGAAGRGRYRIDLGGAPVASIEYDSNLLPDPHEVERAANLAALALERERLSAGLRASRQAVIESRERLIGAADAERQRISRGLHDGLQARLVFIGVEAQRIAATAKGEIGSRATALRDHIDQAAEELRAVVHDLMPPALIELGAAGAVEELVAAMPIPTRLDAALPGRLGHTVEMTAYLVVAEALTNVVKHSGATRCTVSLRASGERLHVLVADNGKGNDASRERANRAGTGLAGIADRVAAGGGISGVEINREGGTTLWADIPYAS